MSRDKTWFFFFNDTATTEIYTLSLHDALPISGREYKPFNYYGAPDAENIIIAMGSVCEATQEVIDYLMEKGEKVGLRSEEHTSELQSRQYLVCRLLLEKKNNATSR